MSGPGKDNDDRITADLASDKLQEMLRAVGSIDEHYREDIFVHLRLRYPRRGADELEDAYQDTMLRLIAMAHNGGFGEIHSLNAWLNTIAHRCATDNWRRRERRREQPAVDYDQASRHKEKNAIWKSEFQAAIRDCYTRLTPELRVVLEIDVMLYLKYEKWVPLIDLIVEVHHRCDPSLTGAAVKYRRAESRKKLRECLRAKGYEVTDD